MRVGEGVGCKAAKVVVDLRISLLRGFLTCRAGFGLWTRRLLVWRSCSPPSLVCTSTNRENPVLKGVRFLWPLSTDFEYSLASFLRSERFVDQSKAHLDLPALIRQRKLVAFRGMRSLVALDSRLAFARLQLNEVHVLCVLRRCFPLVDVPHHIIDLVVIVML